MGIIKNTLLAGVAALSMAGCSLDMMPITEPNNETFLSSENQVMSFVNGLYVALPCFTQYGIGPRGEEKNSDNILAESYDKRLNGEYTAFDGEQVWAKSYENLRDANYFFHYYMIPQDNENDNIRSLKGEVHFFRAYWHFNLLKNFGSFPIMDGFWDGNATIDGLKKKAATRSQAVDYILEDLGNAIELLHTRNVYNGLRINKEAALAFAMNVALFEGSWEKYHSGDAFKAPEDRHEYYYGKVLEYGNQLFELMPVEKGLNTKANDPFKAVNDGDAFAHLFNQKDYSKVNEALFWKQYDIAKGVYHGLVPLLAAGIVDNYGPAGVSQSLVDNYLYKDGTFINPNDEKFKDFNETFKDRDPRLTETVMSTGHKFRSAKMTRPMCVKARRNGEDLSKEDEAYNAEILPPYLAGSGNGKNLTGYHIAIGVDTTFVKADFHDTGYIIIRYAEALLSYAEAAEELGQATSDVMKTTVGALRNRVGVEWVEPVKDANFPDFGYDISANLQEIRRERRTELALQGFRLDDLMRWKADRLIVGQRGRGAYFGQESVLYKSFNTSDDKVAEGLATVLVDNKGRLDPLSGKLSKGYQFNVSRDYLLPIPPDDIVMIGEEFIQQNPGW